jgi:hypothetical protein
MEYGHVDGSSNLNLNTMDCICALQWGAARASWTAITARWAPRLLKSPVGRAKRFFGGSRGEHRTSFLREIEHHWPRKGGTQEHGNHIAEL